MQKILSARLDESAIQELERSSRRLGITKKQFLEEAIQLRAQKAQEEGLEDVWSATLGGWKRRETAQATVRAAREEFNKTFARHRRR